MSSKRVAAVILSMLVASAVSAREAYIKNNRGGEIILTTVECPVAGEEGNFIAYTHAPDVDAVVGCWNASSANILVRWYQHGDNTGRLRVYPASEFQFRD